MTIPGPQDISRHELENGIVLLVRENHSSPSVVVSGYLAVGSYDEPEEQAGLAAFTADGLTRGTIRRSFDQIYEEVESVGASIGFSASVHYTGFGAKSLAEDLPLVLDILADALRHPTFPPQEMEKLRGEILADIRERSHDTRHMASLAFGELAYPQGHPYRRSLIGYAETVSSITRQDLAAFYERGFGSRGMVMVIVGAVEAGRAVELVEGVLGDWEGSNLDRAPLPPVSRPEKTQADILLGYPGPPRSDPAFLDALVCNTVLGVFGMMGRLGARVREEQGLAYYSFSRISGGKGPGPWEVVAGVHPAYVDKAVESIRGEIRRICQEPVGQEELEDTQNYMVGSMPLQLETNEGVARAILNIEKHDLGLDYMERYSGLIRAVTPERVQAAARQWLDPDAYILAIAGPPTSNPQPPTSSIQPPTWSSE